MRHTIIIEDKLAYKNGSALEVDVSGAPTNVHALQFNSATNKGWIEFKEGEDDIRPANEPINQLPDWAVAIFAHYDVVENLNKQPLTGNPVLGS
jgi:hypothetical protein